MKSKIKTLLGLDLYEISGDEIGEHFRPMKKKLPDYCINPKNGQVVTSNYWLQFVNSGEEKYVLFEYQTADKILEHEISGCGLSELLQGTDMRLFVKKFREQGEIGSYNDYFTSIPIASYVVVEITYISNGQFDDCDMFVECVGVLDKDLSFSEVREITIK